VIVDGDAVIYPGTMTWLVSRVETFDAEDLLVVFCNASVAHFTMFTSEGSSYHASNTEMLFVELSCFDEFVDGSLLLTSATSFGYVAWIFKHCFEVEICT